MISWNGLKSVNTKIALALIVLTAVGTYGVSHSRQYHFEPTKLGDGSILLDTETGVECSARFGMKWTEANKKAVWAAGLAAKKLEAKYSIDLSAGLVPRSAADSLPPPQPKPVFDQAANLLAAEDEYNQLVRKADNEEIPDPDSSYFQSFPLCKNIR